MKRTFAMVLVMFALSMIPDVCAETNNASVELASLMRERIRQEAYDSVLPVLLQLRKGEISQAGGQRVSSILEIGLLDELRGKGVTDRQQVVMSFLGNEDYERLRVYYESECKSPSSGSALRLALRMLGRGLFSIESQDVLLPHALSEDPQTQLFAMASLACLGKNGASILLHYMLMHGDYDDPLSSYAVNSLAISSPPNVGRLAVELSRSGQSGPMTVIACLPLMKDEPEYLSLVRGMLLDGRYTPPSRKHNMTLTRDELYQRTVLVELLSVVENNAEHLLEDVDLLRIVKVYAESDEVDNLISHKALNILSKAGVGVEYFEHLITSENLPREKKVILRMLINAPLDR